MNRHVLSCLLALCMGVGATFAQTTLSGTVRNTEGDPLEGAAVLLKGTTIGVFTDQQGNFELEASDEAEALVITYVGYKTQEIDILGKTTFEVALAENLVMDEVVITGYGTQLKRNLTGNIAKVDGEVIENIPVPSVEQALQGRAAGVFVESVNGKPGAAMRVRIRGASSIGASNQPLYVIDGVPITTTAQNLSGADLNPLADLNFNDIESIEILKDASAAAIYGSRAANGVVIITTKQGKRGQIQVDVNVQGGVSAPTGRREFLNAEEYVEMFRRTAEGGARYDWANGLDGFGLGPDYTEANNRQAYLDFVEGRFDRYSGHTDWRTLENDTDWQDQAFQQGQFRQADVSLSGGDTDTRYYASVFYSLQEGILVGNNMEKMSGRLNLDQKIGKSLTAGLQFSLSRTFTDQVANDNQFSTPLQLVAQSPLTPVRDTMGELYDRPTNTYYNGLIDIEQADRDVTTFRNLTNGFLQWDILPGLSLRGELGLDLYTLRDNAFFGRNTIGGESTNGYGYSFWSQVINLNSKLFATYDRTLAEVHSINVVAGAEVQRSQTYRTRTEGQEFPVDDLRTLQSAADITLGESFETAFSFLSYFGRVNYGYDGRYLLTLSARTDASSRFGVNNRYGFFPAASAGWVISEEGFLKGSSVLSFLKLRASYGVTGNAAIGNFNSLGLFGGTGYAGVSGLAPIQVPNPDLTWENTAQQDYGIDFGFFNDRITGELDYYVKNTTDLLLDVPVPGTAGFRSQTQNLGEVQNRGFEIVLNSNNLVGEFRWSTSFNFARNINEVVSLGDQELIDEGSSRYMNVLLVGQPIGVFYGAEYAGVDPETGDGLFFVNETDDEGNVIDPTATTNSFGEANFVVLGSPQPDFIGGINNTFSFKGIDLSFLFQGSFGNSIHNGAGNFMSCGACWFDNQTRDQLDSWTPDNPDATQPEARFFWGNADQNRSSRYLSDGAYLRLKTLSLGYNFPQRLLSRLNLRSARVYLISQNLLTFTNYEGWDPEVTTDFLADGGENVLAGIDFYAAPQPRTITFGLRLGL